MRARSLITVAVLAGLMLASAGRAQEPVPVPPLTARVTDLTGTLGADQIAALGRRLGDFEARKGAQIAVLIVPTTRPETIEQYGIRVAEKWKIGRAKADDGAIVIVAKDDRTLRIEVGYGLEGAVPDLKAARIIREIIVPRFRQDDFYGGLAAGTQALMNLIEGEDLPPVKPQPGPGPGGFENLSTLFVILLVVAPILGAVLTRAAGRLFGSALTGGISGAIAWFLVGTLLAALVAGFMVFVFTLGRGPGLASTGSRRGGGWPGGWSGGGWSGGGGGWSGGGGGWSGGGGGFGGGGASGRW